MDGHKTEKARRCMIAKQARGTRSSPIVITTHNKGIHRWSLQVKPYAVKKPWEKGSYGTG